MGHLGVQIENGRGTRPRRPRTAKNSILTRYHGARSPCRARTPFVFFFSGAVLGLTGPRRSRRQPNPPFRLKREGGGIPHKIYYICHVPPFECNCPPFVRLQYPRMTDYNAFKRQCSKPDRTPPPNGPNRPRVETSSSSE